MDNRQSTEQTVDEFLLSKGIITEEQQEKAKRIKLQTMERIEDILMRLGYASEKQIMDAWAEMLGLSVIDLTNIKVDAKVLSLIPEAQAKQHRIIPYKRKGNVLTVVMADPFDIMATDMVSFLTQCKLEVLISSRSQIEFAIKQLYSWEGFSVGNEGDKKKETTYEEDFAGRPRTSSEESAVVQFLNTIFKQAITRRASDIHVEPREDILLVRFRIDGILHDAMTGPKSLVAPLISRIKILSHLDIAEKRLPQDGRLKVTMQDNEIDFRVSTVPSLLGEKAVLRILAKESQFDLDNIGFFEDDLNKLKSILDEPYGMVLVTGPTGAGKTTTLFGMLKYFDSSEINIFTIENPVEYRMTGITQVQTNDKIGLDFASGLRAALRQDPDVILVGEIRDIETADIAFRASLTGHKVLSTLHTNNAAATINRLINMGLPPYLVTAGVRAVISQKLLHKNCEACAAEYRPSAALVQRLGLEPSKFIGKKFFKGSGCKVCNQTGIYGRLGLYEVMELTKSLKDVILEGGTEYDIKRIARLEGMRTLREAALVKAEEGITTLEEVLYVTTSDEEEKSIFNHSMLQRSNMVPQITIAAPVQAQGDSLGAYPAAVLQTSPNTDVVHQQQIQAKQPPEGLDLNDPVTKAIISAIQSDYLFVSDKNLAKRTNIPELQIKEIRNYLGLKHDREAFENHFGKELSDFSDDEIKSVIEIIGEKEGDLPKCLFEDERVTQKWVGHLVSKELEKLTGMMTTPDDLPKLFTESFITSSGLSKSYEWAHESRFKLVDLAIPGKFKPWQFGETEAWLQDKRSEEAAKEAMKWLMTEKLACTEADLPETLRRNIFKENGLEPLLELFGNSCYNITEAVFPGLFKIWQFPEDEQLLWFGENKYAIAAEATKWLLEEKLGLPLSELPKRVSARDFHSNGLSNLLDLFNQNIPTLIDNAYPGAFKPWQFNEQQDIWKAPEALETAKIATEWLITERLKMPKEKAAANLTRRHFINNGLGNMLGSLFNHSHYLALENYIPQLKRDERFQKTLFNFSQEIREITAAWEAIAEKIALNHFGKAKFKVALPNLKIAPIVPETERIYINVANQIEYVPQIVIPKINAYADFSDSNSWVPYCDKLIYWILADDRSSGYTPPSHPKISLVFAESLVSGLRSKGLLDLIDRLKKLELAHSRLLDSKSVSI